jgi:Holliday junction DNA helicase RuvA
VIAHLRGTVVERDTDRLVVDVGGVGYEVWVATRTARDAPEKVALHVYTLVAEDRLELYGFASAAERTAFVRLIGVSGVGPAKALPILDALPVEALATALDAGDVRALSAVKGIGKKTAELLVLELKGKLSAARSALPAIPHAADDALPLALAQLGYRRTEIDVALAHLAELGKASAPLAERIPLALERLAKGR